MNWSDYPNFTPAEMACKHTGQHGVKPEIMRLLQAMRNELGRPIKINSGYRHPTHPIEARKVKTGNEPHPSPHPSGLAADIGFVDPRTCHELVRLAIKHGATGIGISQRPGQPKFVHVDLMPRKAVWSY